MPAKTMATPAMTAINQLRRIKSSGSKSDRDISEKRVIGWELRRSRSSPLRPQQPKQAASARGGAHHPWARSTNRRCIDERTAPAACRREKKVAGVPLTWSAGNLSGLSSHVAALLSKNSCGCLCKGGVMHLHRLCTHSTCRKTENTYGTDHAA